MNCCDYCFLCGELYSDILVLILPNIPISRVPFFFFKATFHRKLGYCDCASCICNTFWLHPVTLKLADTRCLDAWWKSMWAGWGIEIRISSDGKAGMQVLLNIGESGWRCYEFSDLSKILNTHLLLTTFRVSNSEEAKFHLFHSWNNFCVWSGSVWKGRQICQVTSWFSNVLALTVSPRASPRPPPTQKGYSLSEMLPSKMSWFKRHPSLNQNSCVENILNMKS